MENKSVKKRLVSLITSFFAIFVAIMVLAPLIYTPYTDKEIRANNKDIALTYQVETGNDDYASALSFETRDRYDFGKDGYFTEVFYTGTIYNATDEVLEDVTLTFGFYIDKAHTIECVFDTLESGENNFIKHKIGYTYRRFNYTNIGQISFSTFYENDEGKAEYCNEYMDPEIEHFHYSAGANWFVVAFSFIDGILLIIIVITTISHLKNKMLVEEVSDSFMVGEGPKKQEEIHEKPKKEDKSEVVAYCRYCGGEFFKMHTKCPDCGARLSKKKAQK